MNLLRKYWKYSKLKIAVVLDLLALFFTAQFLSLVITCGLVIIGAFKVKSAMSIVMSGLGLGTGFFIMGLTMILPVVIIFAKANLNHNEMYAMYKLIRIFFTNATYFVEIIFDRSDEELEAIASLHDNYIETESDKDNGSGI